MTGHELEKHRFLGRDCQDLEVVLENMYRRVVTAAVTAAIAAAEAAAARGPPKEFREILPL